MKNYLRAALVGIGMTASFAVDAQTLLCVKCLEALHGEMQACQDKIPDEVVPQNPAAPSAAEMTAASARMDMMKKCAADAQAAVAQCKAKAGCP